MAVYVDDMKAPFGRMVMCHMVADTDDELHAMADKIGVARKWHQGYPHPSHYDIALSKRALAVKYGAVEVTQRELARFVADRRRKSFETLVAQHRSEPPTPPEEPPGGAQDSVC